MATKSYIAKTPITYNGEDYAEGEQIDLDDKVDAPQLLAVDAIEPVKAAAKPTK